MNRRVVLFLFASLFVAFAAYGSFVPFSPRAIGLADAVRQFRATPLVPLARASRSDFVTNVLLFMPVGFLLLGAASYRDRVKALVFAVPVLAISIAISVGIEFGQVFVLGRTPSWNDVVADSLGSAVGCAAWILCGAMTLDWLRPVTAAAAPADRALSLLGVYMAVWLLLGVLPFDFTIRPQELAEKFRAGRIVLEPLGPATSLQDTVGSWLRAIPVGAFLLLLSTNRRLPQPMAIAVFLGAAASVAIEGAQVLAVSRTADINDLFMNVFGTVTGVAIASRWQSTADVPSAPRSVRVWPMAALAFWCVVLIVRHWSPFDFVVTGDYARSRVPALMRVPFYSYYWAMALNALIEAMTKFLLAVPVGALLQLTWTPERRALRFAQAVLVVAVSGGLFLVLELGQLLLPSRAPDQTDIYIGTAGACVGMWVVRLMQRASTDHAIVKSPRPLPVGSSRESAGPPFPPRP
jgi:glycopeptide antibiotics resistance protein